MSSQNKSKTSSRLPPWLKVKLPTDPGFAATRNLVGDLKLNTVCQSARCPNIFECFSCRTATFLIMGPLCSRACAFCNIQGRTTSPLDPDEPRRVAEAASRLELRHVVVTSVTRDDLADGGAGHFAATIGELRKALPGASVEVLIPDFQGDEAALNVVLEAGPDVLNHNVETVPRLYSRIRPQAEYDRSLELLRRAAAAGASAKSGLMVGLGETDDEVRGVIRDLHAAGCAMVTIGQYLRPSKAHPEPERYVHPDVFEEYARFGRETGVSNMFCAPLVRSSYHAAPIASNSA